MLIPPMPYHRLTYLEELNAGIALLVSLVSNSILIYATSRVKTYSQTVRWQQFALCAFRLVFSSIVLITSPTMYYSSEVKALYIIKGGIEIPREIGVGFLNVFIVFIVTSCTGPVVHYLHVALILSNTSRHLWLISVIPIIIAVPVAILIHIGYTPTDYELTISQKLIKEITHQEHVSFLISPEEKIYDEHNGTFAYDTAAHICTLFIFLIMILSIVIVMISYWHIHKTMAVKKKLKTLSIHSLKSQRQLNTLLMVQFIFPFIFIHIPFYTEFILPYVDVEVKALSSNLPYLFSWFPALNPVLIVCMVKSLRQTLICTRSVSTSNSKKLGKGRNSISIRQSPR